MHIDWPMALAIAVGVGLIITAVVYFAGILIVGHLYKKAEDINNGKSQHHLR